MEAQKQAVQTAPTTLEEVAVAFAAAESRLKQSEFYTGLPCVPSINELRYAGCHTLANRIPISPTMAFRVARMAGVGLDDLLAGRYPVKGMCPHCGHVAC